MSLDNLVAGEGLKLCLPHQCEFLSDAWLEKARVYLTRRLREGGCSEAFSLVERFVNAPPHLNFENGVATWSIVFDGHSVEIGRTSPPNPDLLVEADYQVGVACAQLVGARSGEVMAKGMREVIHAFGADAVRTQGGIDSIPVQDILAGLHDHLARCTVENPDLAHRTRAYGLERHLAEIEGQGFTVIERAISDAFADELRAATLRVLLSHDDTQLQWMLYHGVEFERLVQNPQLMTLMDATLGRGACIASISAIRRGPGKGFIPMHNDYSMIPEPYPDFAMTGVGVWALEDWTEASGPTWIVPGSHKERRGPKPDEKVTGVPIEMPKGSVVYFTHGVWHWQGDRSESGDRVTLHSHFNRGILRGLEPKKIEAQMLHRNPPRLGEMLGEDDWFDKLDAHGRDYVRAAHMARLQKFTDASLERI